MTQKRLDKKTVEWLWAFEGDYWINFEEFFLYLWRLTYKKYHI